MATAEQVDAAVDVWVPLVVVGVGFFLLLGLVLLVVRYASGTFYTRHQRAITAIDSGYLFFLRLGGYLILCALSEGSSGSSGGGGSSSSSGGGSFGGGGAGGKW